MREPAEFPWLEASGYVRRGRYHMAQSVWEHRVWHLLMRRPMIDGLLQDVGTNLERIGLPIGSRR